MCPHVRLGQRLPQNGGEPPLNRSRHGCAGDETNPARTFDARHARLGQRRDVRQQRRALAGRPGQARVSRVPDIRDDGEPYTLPLGVYPCSASLCAQAFPAAAVISGTNTTPFFTASTSAMTLTAISAGVLLPMYRPIGPRSRDNAASL